MLDRYVRFFSSVATITTIAFAVAACSGTVGEASNSADDDSGGSGGGNGGGSGSGAGGDGDGCDSVLPAQRLWRLSPQQFKNSIAAGLGVTDVDVKGAPGDSVDVRTGFANSADRAYVSDALGTVFSSQSELAATKFSEKVSTLYTCLAAATVTDACVNEFVGKTGKKLLRRPLTSEETSRYGTFFKNQLKARNLKSAAKVTTQAFLMSPGFLFRSELGEANQGTLDQYEIASALSYSITDSPPADDLLAAAEAKQLTDPAQREKFARALFSTPAARDKFADFIYWQLQLFKAEAKANELGTDVVAGLVAGTKAFVNDVLAGAKPDLNTLMTSNVIFPNAATASLYGVTQTSQTPVRAEVPSDQRFGLFTNPAWLAAFKGPIHRGKIVKNMFLCEEILPPGGVDPAELLKQLPVLPAGATEQEAWAAFQDKNKGCAACHRTFQPLGLALENYDSKGKYRTKTASGKDVIAASEIEGAEGWSGKFSGPGDLIKQIVESQKGQDCFAERYLTYLWGTPVKDQGTSCVASQVAQTFSKNKTDLRELVVAAVSNGSFIKRQPQK